MRIACVVHRFGPEIAGGSEGHCLRIARRLASAHEVTVLTTCARDHVTWRNEHAAGSSSVGPLRVERFPVARPRSIRRFSELSDLVFEGRASTAEQEQWFRENGPESPALVGAVAGRGSTFDRVLFWSFRYYQTFFGLPCAADRAVLVPTAEDDPALRLDVLDRFFSLPSGFIFLTPEERQLVAARCSRPLAPSCIAGCGLDPAPAGRPPFEPLARMGIAKPFALYLGRIEPNKGCDALLRHFRRFHTEMWRPSSAGPVQLVMAGPAQMPVPHDAPWLVAPGYVASDVRDALLAHAALLVVPSPYESLSMVLLEAWNHGVPALVNGRCSVLKGQAERSGGALYYRNADEFVRGVACLVERPEVAAQLGAQGRAHIDREYRWPHVMGTIEALLQSLPPPGSPRDTARSAASSGPA